MNLSWIQKHALMTLMRTDSSRIKDMSPADIPANLFSYHLEGLVAEKLVEKIDRGTYRLTQKGETFAGSISTETNTISKDIKTVVLFYAKKDDQYLLFKWSRHPYLDRTTLPYDRLAYGTSLADGLKKAMQDKLGQVVEATYIKSVLIKIQKQDTVISHMNAVVYNVDSQDLDPSFTSRNGEAVFGSISSVPHMQGLDELIRVIENRSAIPEVTLRY